MYIGEAADAFSAYVVETRERGRWVLSPYGISAWPDEGTALASMEKHYAAYRKELRALNDAARKGGFIGRKFKSKGRRGFRVREYRRIEIRRPRGSAGIRAGGGR
jgi:hypothetical protein